MPVAARADAQSASARADAYGVSWDEPGPGSSASMPLGNGDIGLNVWVDPAETFCSIFPKRMPGEVKRTRQRIHGCSRVGT